MDRRDFLKAAGVGAAALAIPGLIRNASAAPASSILQEVITTDVLIIGGGIAAVLLIAIGAFVVLGGDDGGGGGAGSVEGVQVATVQILTDGSFVDLEGATVSSAGAGTGFIIDESGIAEVGLPVGHRQFNGLDGPGHRVSRDRHQLHRVLSSAHGLFLSAEPLEEGTGVQRCLRVAGIQRDRATKMVQRLLVALEL